MSSEIQKLPPSIADFYSAQDVFITGATGFLGKVLIEKLLISCPNLRNIYVLLRSKRGKSTGERIQELTDNEIYDRIRKQNVDLLNKIKIIEGNVTELQLGIAANDLKQLENVSIIYHVAASVRFDDPLNRAILMNTRGTNELMLIALNLKKLKCLVHVSTTYSNPDKIFVEEKVYPPHWDWKTAIRMAEKCDPEIFAALTTKLTDYFPNTYTFTKGLAEQICDHYKDRLPIVIFRPSVVINIFKEPIPGWIDNFNGPCGIMIASGIGIQRTMLNKESIGLNTVPVDICVNAMIITSWIRGTGRGETSLPVYNCSPINYIRIIELVNTTKRLCREIPFNTILWFPGGVLTTCVYYYYIRLVVYQLIPAVIIDYAMKLMKKKPFILKLQRVAFNAFRAVNYFTSRNWIFASANYDSIPNYLCDSDKSEFSISVKEVDVDNFTKDSLIGCRRYLLKQKDKTLESDRIKIHRFYLTDQFIKYIKIFVVAYIAIMYIYRMLFN